MKSLLAIYSSIFQKCENEKSDLNDEVNLICQAAEEYVEELLSKDRWKFIIKKDIDDLKASLQMRQNYIENHDGVDKKTIGIVARYKFGIDNFLFMISHEMERYGYYIDEIKNPSVQGNSQNGFIPETENGNQNPGEKSEPMGKEQVMMNVKNEPFEPRKNGKPIPYQKCYERLTEGKIRRSVGESEPVEVINKLYDFETFKYCVDRAEIKNIMVEGKKCFGYLFLRCISEYFENPFEYRKAAAKAFGIKTISNVGGRTKMDFYNLFSGIFKNEDIPRKKKK